MSDTAVVLAAAFGGGLAGAVLQPLIDHALHRARTGEEIRKERERKLRRMLDGELDYVRGIVAIGMRIVLYQQRGERLPNEEMAPDVMKRLPVLWQPHRIKDDRLRELAENLAALHREYAEQAVVPAAEQWKTIHPEAWVGYSDRLTELQRAITVRMDDLNWPDADDELDA